MNEVLFWKEEAISLYTSGAVGASLGCDRGPALASRFPGKDIAKLRRHNSFLVGVVFAVPWRCCENPKLETREVQVRAKTPSTAKIAKNARHQRSLATDSFAK